MAAANDSQGLKIAVAVFVMLTVILAVTTYFAYSAYDKAEARLVTTEGKLKTSEAGADLALRQVESLQKETVGARATDADNFKTEIKNELKKVDDELKDLVDQVNAAITKAQASGASGQELEDSKAKVLEIAAAYRSEPNKTLLSALSRSTDLLKNLALLNNELALTYVDVKRSLEGANGVNSQKIAVVEKGLNDSKTDLTTEHDKHEKERASLIAKVDQYQTENAKQASDISALTAKLRQVEDDLTKKLIESVSQVRTLRERVEKSDTILDTPAGVVTYVDYVSGEVHTNLTFNKGARPQMLMSIFDKKSPGLPTDKPKGTIELLKVSNNGSVARIVKTENDVNPMKVGDLVYSAAWSPNDPQLFALIGKIDMNRDGKDDRQDLKRLIEAAGGKVVYDLPPPGEGKETGKLTGREAWFVTDEREPLVSLSVDNSGATDKEYEDFRGKMSAAIRDAKLSGIRPLPIERLLPTLGYDFRDTVVGRVEASDAQALKRLVSPKQTDGKAPTNPGAAPKAEEPADEPK